MHYFINRRQSGWIPLMFNMQNKYHHKSVSRLCFNGCVYNGGASLIEFCNSIMNDEDECLRELAMFLRSWLNDSEYLYLQTSGSTGDAKQIKVYKNTMLISAHKTLSFFELIPGNTALLCLSPKYIAGKMMVVRAMLGQLNLIYFGLSANPLLKLSETIDFAAMVPAQVKKAFSESKNALNSVAKLIIGGAPVDEGLRCNILELQTQCWETFGMTETVSHIALREICSDRNSNFKPLEGVKVSLNNKQCLVIDVPDMLDRELVTNDIAEIKTDGGFRLLGRFDNVINTGGVKVVPEQIELKLQVQIDRKFIIVGLPDVTWGERVVLVVEGEPIEIDKTLFVSLNKFEKPKQVLFVKEFPMTETGKVKRFVVKEMLL